MNNKKTGTHIGGDQLLEYLVDNEYCFYGCKYMFSALTKEMTQQIRPAASNVPKFLCSVVLYFCMGKFFFVKGIFCDH